MLAKNAVKTNAVSTRKLQGSFHILHANTLELLYSCGVEPLPGGVEEQQQFSLHNFSHLTSGSSRQNCVLLDKVVLLLNTQILSNYKDTPEKCHCTWKYKYLTCTSGRTIRWKRYKTANRSCKVSRISHLVGYIQRIIIWSQSDISLLLPIRPGVEQEASE